MPISNIKPNFVKKVNNKIFLRKNIEEKTRETENGLETFYEYEEREIEYRTEFTEEKILEKFDYFWGIGNEQKWKEVRNKRDKLLKETDWCILPDAPLTEQQKQQIQVYRENLRNVPQDYTNPFEVQFPEKPEFV